MVYFKSKFIHTIIAELAMLINQEQVGAVQGPGPRCEFHCDVFPVDSLHLGPFKVSGSVACTIKQTLNDKYSHI